MSKTLDKKAVESLKKLESAKKTAAQSGKIIKKNDRNTGPKR